MHVKPERLSPNSNFNSRHRLPPYLSNMTRYNAKQTHTKIPTQQPEPKEMALVPDAHLMALCKLFPSKPVDSYARSDHTGRARPGLLIYTAFTNLICNKD